MDNTKSKAQKDQLGQLGEDIACALYQKNGWNILHRNWRHRQGELDLIVQKLDVELSSSVISFVEVKTRTTKKYGGGFAAITHQKLARLRRLAGIWLAEYKPQAGQVRIDIVEIYFPRRGPAQVRILGAA